MIPSPPCEEIIAVAERKGATEALRKAILEAWLGLEAKDRQVELTAVDFDRLRDLIKVAEKCRSLAAFRKGLLP